MMLNNEAMLDGPIAIVGGGIGGLCAALALLQRGFDVHVYERAPALLELGAGLQFGPNVSRLMGALGLAEPLAQIACKPEKSVMYRWSDGAVIASYSLAGMEETFGARPHSVHRGELLGILVAAMPADRIHVGHNCTGLDQTDDRVTLHFEGRASVDAALAIGADGLHSSVRGALFGKQKPSFSGYCAYRGIVPWERLEGKGIDRGSAAWLGPDAHIIHYPISSGALLNFVAVVSEPSWTREEWNDQGRMEDLLAHVSGWHPKVQTIVAEVDESRLMKWALCEREPLPTWISGRVALLGDASHPMLPFMGQGAAQAVEDGVVLARCLAEFPLAMALTRYEHLRLPRTSSVQAMARANGAAFHLPDGDAQRARDVQLKDMIGVANSANNPIFGYDASTVPLREPA